MEFPEKMRSYVEALEAERRKIEVFRRELPLCLDLVTQAIEACKQQLSVSETTTVTTSMEGMNGQIPECSEQNSMKGPVLEQFIPIKRSSSSDNNHTADHEEEEEDDDDDRQYSHIDGDDDKKKSDWLDSVQLWNPNPEPIIPHEDFLTKRGSVSQGRASSGGLQPYQSREKAIGKSSQSSGEAASPLPSTGAASTISMVGGRAGKREEKQKPTTERKQRRCWSVDLHRRFVHALQQLGGPHVATPKQIRELMKVNSLTNDEIKSHLQKYRLHTKSCPGQNRGNAQPPQFFVVGGMLMPATQPRHAAAATTQAMARGIYAPVAAGPLPAETAKMQVLRPLSRQKCRAGSSYKELEAHGSSNSTTTSSSGRTVTDCWC